MPRASLAMVRTESRMIPGRMFPERGGVTRMLSGKTAKKLLDPSSSIY